MGKLVPLADYHGGQITMIRASHSLDPVLPRVPGKSYRAISVQIPSSQTQVYTGYPRSRAVLKLPALAPGLLDITSQNGTTREFNGRVLQRRLTPVRCRLTL